MTSKEIDQAPGIRGPSPPGGDDVVRVLQFTDSHLYGDPAGTLAGLNTLDALDRVLADAADRVRVADCVLATGDLVHDATGAGYGLMVDRFGALGLPVHCLPGNHDEPAAMERHLNRGLVSTPKGVRYGPWLLALLDSTIPGEVGGALSDGELRALQSLLDAHPTSEVLVSLHHHPVRIGSEWMDRMGLANPDALFEILDGHAGVRGVLWGHIHQAFEAERSGVRLMGSPSTCIQFLPNEDRFAIDPLAPGYRWLDLHPDGRIVSGVERIAAVPGGLDLATGGYA
jgi:Icc protein